MASAAFTEWASRLMLHGLDAAAVDALAAAGRLAEEAERLGADG